MHIFIFIEPVPDCICTAFYFFFISTPAGAGMYGCMTDFVLACCWQGDGQTAASVLKANKHLSLSLSLSLSSTVPLREIGTGISEASTRVAIFFHDVRGGEQVSSYFGQELRQTQGNWDQAWEGHFEVSLSQFQVSLSTFSHVLIVNNLQSLRYASASSFSSSSSS